jgi:cell cycle sensor histidine kinase DivJ
MLDKVRSAAAAINNHFSDWVHPDVRGDEVLKARHISLIASHLIGGIFAAVVFAGYFFWVSSPGLAATIAALCFLAPVGIALLLSRTGSLGLAHLLSAAQLASLATFAATLTGGTQSFALVWLAIVPLEAALSADRRMMIWATGLAVAALAGLHVAAGAGLLPAPVALPIDPSGAAFTTCLGAVAYAGVLAANVQQVHRGAARELEASRERYRLIAENANDLITRHEASGAITFASCASRPLLGIAPNDLISAGFEPALAAGDRARYRSALRRCLEEGCSVAEEFRIERPGANGAAGTVAWLEMRSQRDRDAEGAGYVIAVTRDVTAAKAEAIELARAREEAERASRAKTAFLATMSHELRTPLSAIIGFAELLHRELLIKAREPKHADYCRIIHQSGEHLLSLVKDLLDVSRIESGKLGIVPEPFALADVVASALDTLRPQAGTKGLSLVNAIEPGLPDLLADRRASKQILINLISNAVKFTPAGGTVTVGACAVEAGIEIAVTDDGIGIAREELERIVQPFYQVETSYARENEGAGLGLSIVRGLIDLHGGTLRIESAPGKGSTFRVTLPVDSASADGVAGPDSAVETRTSEATAAPHIIDLAAVHAQRQHLLAGAAAVAATEVAAPARQKAAG